LSKYIPVWISKLLHLLFFLTCIWSNVLFASEIGNDWHSPYAENDLRVDDKFKTRMAAKDGSFSFDLGTYTAVEHLEKIEYQIADGRRVDVLFLDKGKTLW
jgi:hypothetical protein